MLYTKNYFPSCISQSNTTKNYYLFRTGRNLISKNFSRFFWTSQICHRSGLCKNLNWSLFVCSGIFLWSFMRWYHSKNHVILEHYCWFCHVNKTFAGCSRICFFFLFQNGSFLTFKNLLRAYMFNKQWIFGINEPEVANAFESYIQNNLFPSFSDMDCIDIPWSKDGVSSLSVCQIYGF